MRRVCLFFLVQPPLEILPRIDFAELVLIHSKGLHLYCRLNLLVHVPRAVAVANPGTLEFGTGAVLPLARVSVRIVVDAFVLALAAKHPRALGD